MTARDLTLEATDQIRQALVNSYWTKPYPHWMALAVAKATGMEVTPELTAIIERYIAMPHPDFVAMAEEVSKLMNVNDNNGCVK